MILRRARVTQIRESIFSATILMKIKENVGEAELPRRRLFH
jgi:hypothetical protein